MKKSNKDTLQSYLDSFSVMISEDEIIDALDDEKWENLSDEEKKEKDKIKILRSISRQLQLPTAI